MMRGRVAWARFCETLPGVGRIATWPRWHHLNVTTCEIEAAYHEVHSLLLENRIQEATEFLCKMHSCILHERGTGEQDASDAHSNCNVGVSIYRHAVAL